MIAREARMTSATQLVLRAHLEDRSQELYGLQIAKDAGLPSGTGLGSCRAAATATLSPALAAGRHHMGATEPVPTAERPMPRRPWPARAVRLAALAFSRGTLRDRYRAALRSAPLRSAPLRSTRRLGSILEDIMTTPSKPLLCRTNIRHTWEWARTSDGQRFIRCRRCLKEKDGGSNWQSMTAGG